MEMDSKMEKDANSGGTQCRKDVAQHITIALSKEIHTR